MSSEVVVSNLRRRIAAEVAQQRQAELAELGREAVLWLAVMPSWTRTLARACSFPAGNLDTFIEQAQAAGLCRVNRATPGGKSQELRLLTAIASYLPSRLKTSTLDLALATADLATRARALGELAPVLDEPQLNPLVDVAITGGLDANALVSLALNPRLSTADRDRLQPVAVEAAATAPREDLRPLLLGRLARAALAPTAAAIEAAERLQDPAERAKALVGLADLLDDPWQVDTQIGLVQDPAARSTLRVQLAPHLGADSTAVLRNAAADALACQDTRDRGTLCLAVAEAMAGPALEEATAIAEAIEDAETRAIALGRLAAVAFERAETRDGVAMVERAQGLVATISVPAIRVSTLAEIAGELARHPDVLAATVALAALDEGESLQQDAELIAPLATLIPVLAAVGLQDQAAEAAERGLQAVEKISDPARRVRSGLRFTQWLPADRAKQLLDRYADDVLAVEDLTVRIGLLLRLLPQLGDQQRQSVIEAAAATVRDRIGDDAFWMPESARRDILLRHPDDTSSTPPIDLPELVSSIGGHVLTAGRNGIAVPASIARWAELADRVEAGGTAAPAATFFHEQVTKALNTQDLPGALDWLDTASLLASTLGNELDSSVKYAARRIERLYRDRQYARETPPLLVRQEQLDAFQELLDDETDQAWALHFLGSGGVGKTTLIGHLTRTLDPAKVAIGRVDFDYLTADYPRERPGQLLLGFMAQLELYARGPHQEESVATFHRLVISVHEQWKALPPDARPKPLDDPNFRSLLQSFCDYLAQLDRRIVLFLDTCEELARWQPGYAEMPNVEATFEVMEQLRTMLAAAGRDLRVVFAGRRPLASSNVLGKPSARQEKIRPTWRVTGGRAGRLPVRSYLRLHEVRGFTRPETLTYLRDLRKLAVSDEVLAAILAQSEDRRRIGISWPRLKPKVDGERYLPFDLAMYADWALADSRLTAAQIREGGFDPYVDRRMVGRVRTAGARSLLPALALVRRPDAALLQSTFNGPGAAFRAAFEELAGHDWIQRTADAESPATVELQVEPRLRDRLLAYYQHESRVAGLNRVRTDLLAELRERLDQQDLFSPLLVDDALTMLDDEEATERVQTLILTAAGRDRWDWISSLVGQLLGAEGLVGRRGDHPAAAVVQAAHASWLLHEHQRTEAEPFWDLVRNSLSREKNPARRQWLEYRALLGRAAGSHGEALQIIELLENFTAATAELTSAETSQLVASCCAALELLADQEAPGFADPALAWCQETAGADLPPTLVAQLTVLAARWALQARHPDHRIMLQQAITAADEVDTPVPQTWLDLLLPSSLQDRLRLEALNLYRRASVGPPPAAFARWSTGAGRTIDGDRVRSAVLRIRLAHGLVPSEELSELTEWEQGAATGLPACAAHRETPSLFATIARALVADGRFDEALQLLTEREATEAPVNAEAAREARLGILHTLRRGRLLANRPLVERYAISDDPELRHAALAVLALTGSPQELEYTAPREWRYQSAFGTGAWQRLHDLGELIGLADPGRRSTTDRLDRLEWCALTTTEDGGPETRTDLLGDIDRSTPKRDLEAVARDLLRLSAFEPAALRLLHALSRPIGNHRLAELAFEEGELLALRLPHLAAPLLDEATRLFKTVEDPTRAALANLCAAITRAHAKPDELSATTRQDLEQASSAIPFSQSSKAPSGEADVTDGWLARQLAAMAMAIPGNRSRSDEGRPVELRRGGPDTRPVKVSRRAKLLQLTLRAAVETEAALITLIPIALVVIAFNWLLKPVGVPAFVLAVASAGIAGVALPGFRSLLQYLATLGTQGRVRMVVRPTHVVLSKEAWPVEVITTIRLWTPRLLVDVPESSEAIQLVGIFRRLFGQRTAVEQDQVMTEASWPTPASGRYASTAAGFPVQLIERLRSAGAHNSKRRIRLDVPAELAGLPWEAWIPKALTAPGSTERPKKLQIERSAGTFPGLPAMERRRLMVSVDAPSAWLRATTELWSQQAALETRPAGVSPTSIAVHAIGSALPYQALQIDDRRLGVEELTAGRDTILTLLQAPPFVPEQRSKTDREAAARLKQLGHAVFAAGTWAVVVIPSLPPELALKVAAEYADALASRRVTPLDKWINPRLRRAHRRAQRLIREWSGWGKETNTWLRNELADDLCLYLRGTD